MINKKERNEISDAIHDQQENEVKRKIEVTKNMNELQILVKKRRSIKMESKKIHTWKYRKKMAQLQFMINKKKNKIYRNWSKTK